MSPTSLPLFQSLPSKFSPNPHRRRRLRRLRTIPPPAVSIPSRRHLLRQPRCAGSPPETGEGSEPARATNEVVSGMVEDLLMRDENRGLLDGLDQASRRVDRAREALADIERQEAEALRAKETILQLENRKSEIEESQRELAEARAMVQEARRSLSSITDESSSGEALNEEISKERERWESVKAASISSMIGTLASLPISFYQEPSLTQLILHSAVISFSCALFGVTFRYIIRQDLDNVQLKTGAFAAFGFVRGLAEMEAAKPLEANVSSFISHAIDGAVNVSENILIFLSAAIALDFCFKMGFLSPFPIQK